MSGLHEFADDVLFRPVTVTLLDAVTGETRPWPADEPDQLVPMADAMAAEIERLRLTDIERETIAELSDNPDFYGLTRTHTKVLRGLLERHSATSTREGDQ